MTPIPTTNHDEGLPPLYMPAAGVLVPVLLDGHRWALLPPGDAVTELLLGTEPEAA